jgi:hypothetical protein
MSRPFVLPPPNPHPVCESCSQCKFTCGELKVEEDGKMVEVCEEGCMTAQEYDSAYLHIRRQLLPEDKSLWNGNNVLDLYNKACREMKRLKQADASCEGQLLPSGTYSCVIRTRIIHAFMFRQNTYKWLVAQGILEPSNANTRLDLE